MLHICLPATACHAHCHTGHCHAWPRLSCRHTTSTTTPAASQRHSQPPPSRRHCQPTGKCGKRMNTPATWSRRHAAGTLFRRHALNSFACHWHAVAVSLPCHCQQSVIFCPAMVTIVIDTSHCLEREGGEGGRGEGGIFFTGRRGDREKETEMSRDTPPAEPEPLPPATPANRREDVISRLRPGTPPACATARLTPATAVASCLAFASASLPSLQSHMPAHGHGRRRRRQATLRNATVLAKYFNQSQRERERMPATVQSHHTIGRRRDTSHLPTHTSEREVNEREERRGECLGREPSPSRRPPHEQESLSRQLKCVNAPRMSHADGHLTAATESLRLCPGRRKRGRHTPLFLTPPASAPSAFSAPSAHTLRHASRHQNIITACLTTPQQLHATPSAPAADICRLSSELRPTGQQGCRHQPYVCRHAATRGTEEKHHRHACYVRQGRGRLSLSAFSHRPPL